MTVALAVKVWDGVVLATDSATTLQLPGGSSQVYEHANKTFQLHRRHPIGAMTWGMGALGSASISSLAKDLRRRLMGHDERFATWELSDQYTVEEVAERLVEMLYPLYTATVEEWRAEHDGLEERRKEDAERQGMTYEPEPFTEDDTVLGFLVAGYPGDPDRGPELFSIEFAGADAAPDVIPVLSSEAGWVAYAQSLAVERLFHGVDPALKGYLAEGEFTPPDGAPGLNMALNLIGSRPVVAAMPFQDAINFARFLADVSVGFSRYTLGPNTVGGAVEVAGISRHEGFKWVDRKHYFSAELNPRKE